MSGVMLRPVRDDDAEAVWDLLAPVQSEVIGMSSLPSSPTSAKRACAETADTIAALATGSFTLDEQAHRRLLFIAVERNAEPDGTSGSGSNTSTSEQVLGITGITFKNAVLNLAVQVSTSEDGHGLIMRSTSSPWTRTELDSTFLGPSARGKRLGSLVSRGRFMLLHLVHSQIPSTVASHLRGRFDDDGSAPFWRCFGAHFAPEWETSTEAEHALIENPHRLQDLADHRLALTAPVLDSLGPVNAASLPAFHMLRAEGLNPNGMYDPIDGGPTLRAELADTVTGKTRTHGRAVIEDLDADATRGESAPERRLVDALVSVTTVARFRVTRATVALGESGPIGISAETADALNIGEDTLIVAAPL